MVIEVLQSGSPARRARLESLNNQVSAARNSRRICRKIRDSAEIGAKSGDLALPVEVKHVWLMAKPRTARGASPELSERLRALFDCVTTDKRFNKASSAGLRVNRKWSNVAEFFKVKPDEFSNWDLGHHRTKRESDINNRLLAIVEGRGADHAIDPEMARAIHQFWVTHVGQSALDRIAADLREHSEALTLIAAEERQKSLVTRVRATTGSGDIDPSPAAAPPPMPLGGVELIGLPAASRDRITLSIEPELSDGRITLKEIGYSFDAPRDDDSSIRVCLKRITIDWNWGNEPQATLVHATAAERRQALCETNPGLRVTRARKDSARLEFSVEHEDGTQFLAPLPDTALERLVLPQATHRPGAETVYTFELLASWQDVGVAEAVSAGVFRKMLDAVAGLTPARKAILELVREVKAQLENDFPTDGTLKTLGTRVAKVRLARSTANEAVPA